MTKAERPEIPKEIIEEFCKRRHIRKLAIFGSYLREDFGPDSDIDFLVEFDPKHIPWLLDLVGTPGISYFIGVSRGSQTRSIAFWKASSAACRKAKRPAWTRTGRPAARSLIHTAISGPFEGQGCTSRHISEISATAFSVPTGVSCRSCSLLCELNE